MLRKNKLKNQIAKKIQLDEYKEAMRVPDYNQGRTLANVDVQKSKIDGTRKFLRPDTFWADERYVNVNQNDIDEARKRYEARVGNTGKKSIYIMETLP